LAKTDDIASLPTMRGAQLMQNDALNILSARFAKGEITEDEYDRLANKLSGSAPPSLGTRGTSPQSDTAKTSSAVSSPSGNKFASWIGGIAGLYAGACILLAFAASPSSTLAAVNDGCRENGGSMMFCQCYATEVTKGYSFLSAPLWYAGIGRVAPTQANYICNNRG
jgi:hypothetical protein